MRAVSLGWVSGSSSLLKSIGTRGFSLGEAACVWGALEWGVAAGHTPGPWQGGTWRLHGVSREQVLARMEPVRTGLPQVYPAVERIIEHAVRMGWIKT